MTRDEDFEDRMAARLLGVDVDADATLIRSRFRRLVRAVHPDQAVGVACIDLGRLAEAKDRLVARADRREAAMVARRVAALDATELHAAALRTSSAHHVASPAASAAASRLVEAMRLTPQPAQNAVHADVVLDLDFENEVPAGEPRRGAFVLIDRLGQHIDYVS